MSADEKVMQQYALVPEDEKLIRRGLALLTGEIVECTIQSGWREKPRTDGETCALIHSEVSEAFEGMRAKLKPESTAEYPDGRSGDLQAPMEPVRGYNASKKLGPAFNTTEEEFADVLIRVIEEADRRGLDLVGAMFAKMRFNRQRPLHHGGKKL